MAKDSPALYGELYFEQARRAMLARKAIVLPEHTTQSEFDWLIAALRIQAGDHHGLVTLLDGGLAELSHATATRRGSFVALGLATGSRPARDVPAAVEVTFDLQATPAPGAVFLDEASAIFGASQSHRLRYENTEGIGVPGALELQHQVLDDGGTLSDFTGTLWGAPWQVDDALYLGHPEFMFDSLALEIVSTGSGSMGLSVEYFDDHEHRADPDSVALTTGGDGLRLEVRSFVEDGFADAFVGGSFTTLPVRVHHKETGTWEDGVVIDGDRVEVGFLGQASPSLVASDYELTAEWLPVPILTDDSDPFGASPGDIWTSVWSLPDTESRRWKKTTIGDLEGFFVRLRVADPPAAAWEWDNFAVPDDGTWSGRVRCLQGVTLTDYDLGSTDGSEDQEFTFGATEIAEDGISAVYVDGDVWDGIETLYAAGPTDKRYEEFEDPRTGAVGIRLGDGVNGALPSGGLAVTADVRVDASQDGNVGALEVDRILAGLGGVSNVRNPRPAAGWARREGADPDDEAAIRLLRRRGPARYRARRRAHTPDDIVAMLTDPTVPDGFVASDGSRPVKRAGVILEGAGPKTAKVAVVGTNGATLTSEQLAEITEYFGGTTSYLQRRGGVMTHNQAAEVVNYTPDLVSFAISVRFPAKLIKTATQQAAVKAAMLAILDKHVHPLGPPLAANADDDWMWAMGQDLDQAMVAAALACAVSGMLLDSLVASSTTASTYGLPMHDRAATTIALVAF